MGAHRLNRALAFDMMAVEVCRCRESVRRSGIAICQRHLNPNERGNIVDKHGCVG